MREADELAKRYWEVSSGVSIKTNCIVGVAAAMHQAAAAVHQHWPSVVRRQAGFLVMPPHDKAIHLPWLTWK